MKLNEFRKKVRTDERFRDARQKLHSDIAFRMGHMIETLRINLGLSQSQFGERVGMQQSAIARMERGTIAPSLPILQKIANELELTLILPSFVYTKDVAVESESGTFSATRSMEIGTPSPYIERIGSDTQNIIGTL